MTYTFKLARRLAVSRRLGVLTATLLIGACLGDSTAPEPETAGVPAGASSFEVSPHLVTVEVGQLIQFRGRSRGANSRGDTTSVPVAWGATGGAISLHGTFSSSVAGSFKIIGRGRGWRRPDTSSVVVVPKPLSLSRIAVTPRAVLLGAGEEQNFVATGRGAEGAEVPVGVNWSAAGGSINPGGTFTADSAPGVYRIIAASTDGSLADTALVTVEAAPGPAPSPAPTPAPSPSPSPSPTPTPTPTPTPAPTLAQVRVVPASLSLASGASRQFSAFGRDSKGDSVAVSVQFRATGGTMTSGGLYTAGGAGGAFQVIAVSSALADTARVTVTPSPIPAPSGGRSGVPFGPAQLLVASAQPGPFSFSIEGTTSATILEKLSAARAAKVRLILNMTGGKHTQYLTGGVFDRSKWQSKMDTYNTPEIRLALAEAVANGTVVGASVMDEPNVQGLGDGNTWGPPGTMTKARVDSLCAYAKSEFPTLPVGVVHPHQVFDAASSYRVCEFLVDAYSARFGSVSTFRDQALAMGRRDGLAIVFSMNILNGGPQAARDGQWNCPAATTGGRGQYEPNCRMSPQLVREAGLVLGPAGCGLLMWQYNSDFMSKLENQQAFADVATRLASEPGSSCRRR